MRKYLIVVVALAAISGFDLGSGVARAQDASLAIPPNYRQQITHYLLARIKQEYLRTAMIAKPYNKPDGLIGRLTGSTVPVICVFYEGKNAIGMQAKSYFVFWFENGDLRLWDQSAGILASECGAFSPFTEVIKR